tara:strand:+ start:66 stop:374 length:309 start_codon:yes stop_codon:yes gene_type:complete
MTDNKIVLGLGLQELLRKYDLMDEEIISDLNRELRKKRIITENIDTPVKITMVHVSQLEPDQSKLTWLTRGDANDMIHVINRCKSEIARLNTPFQTYNPFLV